MTSFIDEMPPDIDDGPPEIEILDDDAATIATKTTGADDADDDATSPAEEKTMMEQMMELQAEEQKKKIAKREKQRKKQDKSFGAGLKGGFFNQPTTKEKDSTKKKKKKKKKSGAVQTGFLNGFLNTGEDKPKKKPSSSSTKTEDDDVDFEIEDDIIRPKIKKKDQQQQDFQSSLRFDEVQNAMKSTVENQSQWMTPDFLERVAKNPKLAMAMTNPRCMQAMQEFQTDPTGAAEKYKDDEMVNTFMQEFMGMMGDQMHKLGEKEKSNKIINERAAKEEAMKKVKKEDPDVARVLSNPEVYGLLNDPEMKAILQECSTTDGALGKYMRDPKIRQKLELMKKYGLIQF